MNIYATDVTRWQIFRGFQWKRIVLLQKCKEETSKQPVAKQKRNMTYYHFSTYIKRLETQCVCEPVYLPIFNYNVRSTVLHHVNQLLKNNTWSESILNFCNSHFYAYFYNLVYVYQYRPFHLILLKRKYMHCTSKWAMNRNARGVSIFK